MFMHPYISHEIARARQRDLLEDAGRQRLAGRLRARPGTTRHHGGRVLVAALAAAAALVLVVVLAGCGGSSTGPGGHGGNSTGNKPGDAGAPGAASGQLTLAGEWVGTVPGDEGDCGTGSGEWIFDPDNGTYQFDAIYDSGECGYQSNGIYQVQGDSIYFQPQDESAFQAIYSIDDGDLVLCDVPDTAECNYYYNQPMQ
jgi:Lipocalin-like domain